MFTTQLLFFLPPRENLILLLLQPMYGKNLWKAIYQLSGDIIVYIDADIKNIHPRFVYGLVGPLIYRDEMRYVKAF